jgi:hypothetical protein
MMDYFVKKMRGNFERVVVNRVVIQNLKREEKGTMEDWRLL